MFFLGNYFRNNVDHTFYVNSKRKLCELHMWIIWIVDVIRGVFLSEIMGWDYIE